MANILRINLRFIRSFCRLVPTPKYVFSDVAAVYFSPCSSRQLFNRSQFIRSFTVLSEKVDKEIFVSGQSDNEIPVDIPATGAAHDPEILTDLFIPPPPAPPVLPSDFEPSLASQGLCKLDPFGLVQWFLETCHVSAGLPWWGCIVIGSVVTRFLILPLMVLHRKKSFDMMESMPKQAVLQTKLNAARRAGDYAEGMRLMKEFQETAENPKVFQSLYRSFPLIMGQSFIFISVFHGIRAMTSLPVVSMKHGGVLWFQNLTLADPFSALPVFISGTLFLALMTGAETGAPQQAKLLTYGIPIVILPFVCFMPSALQLYWVVGNTTSLVFMLILNQPKIMKILGLRNPDFSAYKEATGGQNIQPLFTIRESMKSLAWMQQIMKKSDTHQWMREDVRKVAKEEDAIKGSIRDALKRRFEENSALIAEQKRKRETAAWNDNDAFSSSAADIAPDIRSRPADELKDFAEDIEDGSKPNTADENKTNTFVTDADKPLEGIVHQDGIKVKTAQSADLKSQSADASEPRTTTGTRPVDVTQNDASNLETNQESTKQKEEQEKLGKDAVKQFTGQFNPADMGSAIDALNAIETLLDNPQALESWRKELMRQLDDPEMRQMFESTLEAAIPSELQRRMYLQQLRSDLDDPGRTVNILQAHLSSMKIPGYVEHMGKIYDDFKKLRR